MEVSQCLKDKILEKLKANAFEDHIEKVISFQSNRSKDHILLPVDRLENPKNKNVTECAYKNKTCFNDQTFSFSCSKVVATKPPVKSKNVVKKSTSNCCFPDDMSLCFKKGNLNAFAARAVTSNRFVAYNMSH